MGLSQKPPLRTARNEAGSNLKRLIFKYQKIVSAVPPSQVTCCRLLRQPHDVFCGGLLNV